MRQTSLFNFSKTLKDWVSCRRSTTSCDRAAYLFRAGQVIFQTVPSNLKIYIYTCQGMEVKQHVQEHISNLGRRFSAAAGFFRGGPGEPRGGGQSRTAFSDTRGTRRVTFWRWRDVQIEEIKRPGWITETCMLLNVHSSCGTWRAKGKFGAKQVKFSLLFWCGTKPHDTRTPYFCLLSLDSRLTTSYSIWRSWKKLNE